MKKFSNFYIFGFASVLVIIVAALLSFVSEELKPMQERNVEVEIKQGILQSVNMTEGVKEADNKNTFIEAQFDKYISNSLVVNAEGQIIEGRDAFEITKNLKAEYEKSPEERGLPFFIFTTPSGAKKYIIPVRGKGLWGPIWGYVALNDDYNTIYGTVFANEKETPGLGAEISELWFQAEFKGKTIFNETGDFVSIEVVKGGTSPDNPHGVNAVSGGTITSKGLQNMLMDSMKPYLNYLKKQMKKGGQI